MSDTEAAPAPHQMHRRVVDQLVEGTRRTAGRPPLKLLLLNRAISTLTHSLTLSLSLTCNCSIKAKRAGSGPGGMTPLVRCSSCSDDSSFSSCARMRVVSAGPSLQAGAFPPALRAGAP